MESNINTLFDKITTKKFKVTKAEANDFARTATMAARERAVAYGNTARNPWYQFCFYEADLAQIKPELAVFLGLPLGGFVQFEVSAGRTNHVEVSTFENEYSNLGTLPASHIVFQRGTHAFFREDKPMPFTSFQLSACRQLAHIALGDQFFDAPNLD